MGDISASVLVRQIEEMYCACSVQDVDCDVADLTKAVRAFVQAHEL
jgi:hypothetical protein